MSQEIPIELREAALLSDAGLSEYGPRRVRHVGSVRRTRAILANLSILTLLLIQLAASAGRLSATDVTEWYVGLAVAVALWILCVERWRHRDWRLVRDGRATVGTVQKRHYDSQTGYITVLYYTARHKPVVVAKPVPGFVYRRYREGTPVIVLHDRELVDRSELFCALNGIELH